MFIAATSCSLQLIRYFNNLFFIYCPITTFVKMSVLQENASNPSRKTKQSELYNYKVTGLINNDTMIVLNVETDQKYVVKVLQKTVGFSNDCMIFPKHVPYMTKLQRWHYTDDAIFLLFNYTR